MPISKETETDEAGSDSFVATEELSQTSCDESVSDESYKSDTRQTVSFKTSQNRTDCVNILILSHFNFKTM